MIFLGDLKKGIPGEVVHSFTVPVVTLCRSRIATLQGFLGNEALLAVSFCQIGLVALLL